MQYTISTYATPCTGMQRTDLYAYHHDRGCNTGGGMHVVVNDNDVTRVEYEVAIDVCDIAFLRGISHSIKACHAVVVSAAERAWRGGYVRGILLVPPFIQGLELKDASTGRTTQERRTCNCNSPRRPLRLL